jgi:hypothetical protein
VSAYSGGHYCAGSGDATFSGGTVPAGIRFIENLDYRANSQESADPNLKPYSQHETTFGFEYQLTSRWIATGRWDRRRVDHIIEDGGILDADGNEIFTIINPGEGINKTISGCSGCSDNIKAARSYDGVEFALKHNVFKGLQANLSYTYSKLRGNYSGLTSTDVSDAGTSTTARESANNSRAFDEPYFQYDAYGRSSSGPLATDRPNAFKVDGSYQKRWNSRNSSLIGIFQQIYSGTPLSSYLDVQEATGYPVYVEGRGKWINVTTDSNGFAQWGKVYDRRTEAFLQTDASVSHSFTLGGASGRSINFQAIITNALNQRAVTKVYSVINSQNQGQATEPAASTDYYVLTHKYDYQTLFNEDGVQLSNEYGKPLAYQSGRSIRLRIAYNF